MDSDKKRKLETTINALQDRWGSKAIGRWKDNQAEAIPYISTGFPTLDEALVIGGLPRGRISEINLTSPHSRIFVEIEGQSGEPELWAGETWPVGSLYRRGLTHDQLAVGDVVRVTGERANEGRKGLHLRSIYRPADGYRVWIGLRSDTGENSADGIGDGINTIQLEDDSV